MFGNSEIVGPTSITEHLFPNCNSSPRLIAPWGWSREQSCWASSSNLRFLCVCKLGCLTMRYTPLLKCHIETQNDAICERRYLFHFPSLLVSIRQFSGVYMHLHLKKSGFHHIRNRHFIVVTIFLGMWDQLNSWQTHAHTTSPILP